MSSATAKFLATLLFPMFLLSVRRCQAVWRYSSSLTQVEGFTTRNPIVVEHLETVSDLQWKVEPACHVTPQGSLSASIQCSSAGLYTMYPDIAGAGASDDNTLHMQVLDSPGCYRWYLTPVNRTTDVPNSSGEMWLLHVWIVDDRHASLSELNNTAQEPSEYSAQLTELSWRKKQHPEVRQLYSSHVQHVLSKRTAYNRNSSLWEIVVAVDSSVEQAVVVSGQPVLLDNCFVRDMQVLLYQPQFTDVTVSSSVSLKGSVTAPVLVQSPVSSGVALLITSTEILLTQDSFLTTDVLIIPDDVLQSCNDVVHGAAFTASHLYVIACNSLLRTAQNGTWEQVTLQGSSGGFVGIKSRERHSRVGRAQMDDECLAVWTDTQLYLKTSSQNSLELTSLPTAQLGASGYNNHSVPILDVSFSSHPEGLGVLVHVQTSGGEDKVMILQYDLTTAVWSLPESTMEYTSAGNFTLVYLASALPEALVWDHTDVTYSFSNGTGTLQILEGNTTSNLIEAPLDSIQEITVGPNGDFVIHLASNKLYYGRVDKENVIELTPGELPEAEFVLYFDMLGRLHLVNYDSTSSSATARLFPLPAEVYSSLYPETSCPYYRFSHNFDVDGYYIDVGEELQIWASLMYPNGSYNGVEVLVRDGHLLQQNFSSEILPSSLYTTENMTLHLSSNVTFEMLQTEDSGSSDRTTGVMMIEVRPKQTSYVCQGPVNMVTSISVGCPPNRHIRVRRPSRTAVCSSYQNYIYTLSPDMYDSTYKGESAGSAKEVTYDLDNLGCPIDVFYSDKFRPTVDLYDGDQFVHEVKADYFVWETHGRTGYAYSATMQQAGCVCEAQTLGGMLTAGNVSSPNEAWGPQNYRPCSTPCDPSGSLTGQYEVLSSLGVSALMFGSNKGIFVFNLKVLDPECSYCVLQTQFAVRVYGSPRESLNLYVYISVLAFILGTVVILVLTYYRYYKLMAEEHQKLLQELTNKEEEDGRGEEDGEGEKEEEKEEEIQ